MLLMYKTLKKTFFKTIKTIINEYGDCSVMAGKNKKKVGKSRKTTKKKVAKPKPKAKPKSKKPIVQKKKVQKQAKKQLPPQKKPVQEKKYKSPEELQALLSKQEQLKEPQEPEVPPSPDSEKRAMMGRCVGRTFNYDEAKGICQQFEAAGYETAVIEKKRGGLSLYEVWASKREEVIF